MCSVYLLYRYKSTNTDGLCDWLYQLLRALAPAVSFEGAAKELSQASQVRALVDAAYADGC